MTPQDDLEELRPYLTLAREIRAEVDRVAATGPHTGAGLEAALDAVPKRERRQVARAVFDRLSAEQQWAVLERVFDDGEIRSFLADRRQRRREEVERGTGDRALAMAARGERRLDLGMLPSTVQVTVGLFRPAEVQEALLRGAASSACARQVTVRAGHDGLVRVLADVFNPRHGYFVTADYDETLWSAERLASHSIVRLGSAVPTGDAGRFEPVLYPGGRMDVEIDGTVRRGHLHVGFALIGEEEAFATAS